MQWDNSSVDLILLVSKRVASRIADVLRKNFLPGTIDAYFYVFIQEFYHLRHNCQYVFHAYTLLCLGSHRCANIDQKQTHYF